MSKRKVARHAGWEMGQRARLLSFTVLACALFASLGPELASAASHAHGAELGYSLKPSATEPYSVCAQPKPRQVKSPAKSQQVKCMSVVIPPSAVASGAPSAPDVRRVGRGRFAPLFDSAAPDLPADQVGSSSEGGGVGGFTLEGSGEEGGLSPADLRSAYRLPSSGGSGQTIAIVIAYDNPNAESDLKTYRARYGLPECTTANGCFKKINQEGKVGSYPSPDPGWSMESSLDVDMASAICPSCHILLVEANSSKFSDLGIAEEKAASYTAAGWGPTTVISNSWGAKEVSEEEGGAEELELDKYFNHPGIPVLFSSGDSGYGVSYPAASQYVVSVGGTALFKTPFNERGWFEETWIGSGGGCSLFEPKPSWQTDTGCAKRMGNDVAAVASLGSAVSVYDSYQAPGWIVLGGTSVSAPIVAGVEGLSNATTRSEGAQAFYKNPKSLFDVTTGSNLNVWEEAEDCSPKYLCNAGEGYDGPTGNGTPNFEGGGEGLPRKWTAMTMRGVENESRDVSCVSSSFCMEVGSEEDSQGWGGEYEYPEGFASAEVWDGAEWSPTADMAAEAGGKQYRLWGVSCTSSTFCTAVGRYTNSSSTTVTLAETWNGTKWSIQPTPNPSGALSSRLLGVSCTSSTACMAVGYYTPVVGEKVQPETMLIERWNGTEWSIQSPPSPSGAGATTLSGLSCTSSTFCVATGSYQDTSSGVTYALAEHWNGTEWSYQTMKPSGGLENHLFGVSCTSTSFCMAVGHYYLESTGKALIETWNGSKWTQSTAPSTETEPYLYNVSCTSSSFCEAAGIDLPIAFSSAYRAAAERWNGSTWSVEKIPQGELIGSAIYGVSCSASATCMATGYYSPKSYFPYGNPPTALAFSLSGTTWSLKPVSSPNESKGVSCSSSSSCVAVGGGAGGKRYSNSGIWNGGTWFYLNPEVPSGATSSSLAGVSCPSAGGCEAVGSYVDSSGTRKTLAERASNTQHIRYLEWSIQSTPNPAGAKAASLNGVSCASASSCSAVGTYTDSSGTQLTLAENWNGSSWSIQSTPNPAGAKAASLNGVSCASASSCSAVGTYTDSSGTQLTLAENWNGSSWSIQSTPNPAGAKAASLNGVSCASYLCMSTGYSTSKAAVTTGLSEARWGSGPVITTEPATTSYAGVPTLNASINPDGLSTTYQFEYGLTESYGSKVPASPAGIGSGTSAVKVSQPAPGLKPRTKYHFRVVASNEMGTTYSADRTFTTNSAWRWFACTKQTGGKYNSSKCSTEGTPKEWESILLKEAEKTTITAKGNPIAFTATISGLKGTLNCETEVASPSLENPSGGGNGIGNAEVKYKGCKVESGWESCKAEPSAIFPSKLELVTVGGKARAVLTPKEGSTFANFNFSGCKTEALNGTWALNGTLVGLYSSTASQIEFNTETTAEGLTLKNSNATAVGSIKLETTAGGYLKAELATPIPTTGTATGIKPTKATLEGTVNPEGADTQYRFEYGKTTAYGQSTPLEGAGEGFGNVKVAQTISGLTPGTKYHYRLIAIGGLDTAYGSDMTFTSGAAALHWFGCTKQTGGKYTNSKCSTEGSPKEWESIRFKEAEKTTITATGNPIAFTATIAGIKGTFTCETEVVGASLENPSGAGNGIGNAEVKYKGCKAEGTWGEKGCKVESTANYASKLALTTTEGKAQVALTPSSGEVLATFSFSSCSVGGLNGTRELKGSLRGLYSNADSKVEYNAETTTGWLTLSGQNTTAVGSIGLKTSGGGYIKASSLPIAITEGASGVTPTAATLEGTVNPDGSETQYRFEYGKTTAYGQSTPLEGAGEGFGNVKVAQTISGLTPGTKYHYRLTATSGLDTAYGADMTFTSGAEPLHWFGCELQVEGKYRNSQCIDSGSFNVYESVRFKEAEKTTITATGNPIAFTATLAGIKGTFTCETEVVGASLENPSGGGNGIGNAEVKYKGCKAEGTWGEKGCKVESTANYASKLALTTTEGKAQVALTPSSGEVLATFSFSSCSVGGLNGTRELKGTLLGLYSNADSMIEFNAEITTGWLTLSGQNTTAVGSIGLKASNGGYIRAE